MLVVAARTGTVVVSAGALLLLWAGLPKLSSGSRWLRVAALCQVLAAVAVLVGPGRAAAALLAAFFLVFSAVHVRGIGAGATSCQCFGEQDTVDPVRAAALTALVVGLAAAAAAVGSPSLREL